MTICRLSPLSLNCFLVYYLNMKTTGQVIFLYTHTYSHQKWTSQFEIKRERSQTCFSKCFRKTLGYNWIFKGDWGCRVAVMINNILKNLGQCIQTRSKNRWKWLGCVKKKWAKQERSLTDYDQLTCIWWKKRHMGDTTAL